LEQIVDHEIMKPICSSIITGVMLALVFANAGWAQNVSADDPEITLNVDVTTKKGVRVPGLRREDFRLYAGKVLQPITSFSTDDAPMTIGILVDRSASIPKEKVSVLQEALKRFVISLPKDHEYFVATFNRSTKLVVDRTQDTDTVLEGIDRLSNTEPRKDTQGSLFYDSINYAVEKMEGGTFRKKILITASDAIDTGSDIPLSKVKESVLRSGATLYNISWLDIGSDAANFQIVEAKRVFDDLFVPTGGGWIRPRNADYLYEELRNSLLGQYTIRFKPPGSAAARKQKWIWLTVKVELPLTHSNVGKIIVATRAGYYPNTTGN
jgi:Ca-activated chloride channel family protein